MTQGIFALSFESDEKQIGSGFAVFIDGKITGGDTEFVYHGTYHCNESSSPDLIPFTAKVIVQYYKGINLAIFGKMTRFPIELSGMFTAEELLAHGNIKKFGNEDVDLKGTKIDDLQLEILEKNKWINFNVKDKNIFHTVNSAIDLHQKNCYIDATNMIISVIELVIFCLFENFSNESVKCISFLDKINILAGNGFISSKIKSSLLALFASNNVLDKKMNSPEDCAFPLSIMAFSLLDKLLEIQNDTNL
jgi:T3SS negative regulator,GrlR